jgi:hypothetical protein
VSHGSVKEIEGAKTGTKLGRNWEEIWLMLEFEIRLRDLLEGIREFGSGCWFG